MFGFEGIFKRNFGLSEVGLVAQLVRAPPCHGGGHGFESRLGRRFLYETGRTKRVLLNIMGS